MLQWLLTHTPLLYFTQSLWRDEAFSILAAEKPLSFFFTEVTFEPPFYYILLHFWIKIFGSSEIAARSLSLTGFALATGVTIIWAEKLFKKRFLSLFLPLSFLLNPMLLYYAFEVRAYGWYIFFAVWSFYTYLERKWPWYIVSTVLGFYTHTYFLFIPFVQFLHWLTRNKIRMSDPFIRSISVSFLLMAPWLIKIITELGRLKSSWYFPVDGHLLKSVLGNMFLGYEGTPWYLWEYTAILSLVLLIIFLYAKNLFFFMMVMLPLGIVLAISFVKPIFVNRYLIPVSIAEVFLLAFALNQIKTKMIQRILGFFILLLLVLFNSWYPKEHPKLDIRKTILEVNALRDNDDVILAESPLIFFESIYYSGNRDKVFLYNPNDTAFPWYVGDAIVQPNQITRNLPPYPIRAYLIHENGSYDITYKTTPIKP